MWQQEKVIRSDIRYLAAQITLFIVLYVCSVMGSVLDRQLIFVLDFPTTRVILTLPGPGFQKLAQTRWADSAPS